MTTPPPLSKRVPVPATRADKAALASIFVLPCVGALLKFMNPGWMLLGALLVLPLTLVLMIITHSIFGEVLGETSPVREVLGRVPTRFHVLAWVWSVAVMSPGIFLLDGSDVGPWRSWVTRVLGLGEPSWYWPFQVAAGVVVVLVAIAVPFCVRPMVKRVLSTKDATYYPIGVPQEDTKSQDADAADAPDEASEPAGSGEATDADATDE